MRLAEVSVLEGVAAMLPGRGAVRPHYMYLGPLVLLTNDGWCCRAIFQVSTLVRSFDLSAP